MRYANRQPTFELLEQRRLLTAVNTLVRGSGIRFRATVLAENDNALFVEGWGRSHYEIHHTDGRTASSLAVINGFEDFVDHPATGVQAVGDHWLYLEPIQIPFDAEPGFVPAPGYLASDGTTEGTFSVSELLPHGGEFIAAVGNLAVFHVTTPEHGNELWTADLQARSAEAISDLAPGSGSLEFGEFFATSGWLYFTVNAETSELWRTNGNGAEQLEFRQNHNIAFLAGLEDRIWFETSSALGDRKIWALNHASDTPELLLSHDRKIEVKADQNKLYFELVDGDQRQLWASDGSITGTVMLSETGGDQFFQTSSFTYFVQDAALVRSDGTVDGTAKIFDGAFEIVDSADSFLLIRSENELLSFRDDSAGPVIIKPPFPTSESTYLVATDDAMFFQHQKSIGNDPEVPERSQTLHRFWKTYGGGVGDGFVAEWFSPPIFDGGEPWTLEAWALEESIVFHSKYPSSNFAPDFTIIAGFDDASLAAHAGGELSYELLDLKLENVRRIYEIAAGEDLQLDASGSQHAPNLQSSYDWDLDGDGQFDDAVGIQPVISSQRISELWSGEPFEAVLRVSAEGVDSVTDRVEINCTDCVSDVDPPFPGDSNRDGVVDIADFLILSANFGKVDAAWADGDFDASGDVGFSDFLLMSVNFGRRRA